MGQGVLGEHPPLHFDSAAIIFHYALLQHASTVTRSLCYAFIDVIVTNTDKHKIKITMKKIMVMIDRH